MEATTIEAQVTSETPIPANARITTASGMDIVNKLAKQRQANILKDWNALFDAMAAGRKIKLVKCFLGDINKNDSKEDFTIVDFTAETYLMGTGAGKHPSWDMVTTDKAGTGIGRGTFFMHWVKSFELYPNDSLN